MLIGELFKIKNKKIRNHFFSGLSFNSNSCKKNFIFFAIKGNLQDGNKYIDEAIENGARTIVHQNQVIGSYTMIGMGSIITRKKIVKPGYIFYGKPIKLIKKNCFIGLTTVAKKANINSKNFLSIPRFDAKDVGKLL